MYFDILKWSLGMGITMVIIVFALLIWIAFYVIQSVAYMKALKALGYDKAWLAWIPYVQYYACADAVSDNQENVYLFNKFLTPVWLFKFWWAIALAIGFLPLLSTVSGLLKILLQVFFLGAVYTKMYARLEYKQEQDTQVIGCISGLFPIIASIKFIMLR